MNPDDLLADGTVTVAGGVKEFGIGRTVLYVLMQRGELPYSKIGTRRLIPRVAIRKLIGSRMCGADVLAK